MHTLNTDPYQRRSQSEEDFGTKHPTRFEPRSNRAFQGMLVGSILSLVPELSLPASPTEGQFIYTTAGHQMQFWNGTVWVGISSSSVGVASVTGTAGQVTVAPTTGNVIVSLPATITESITFNPGPIIIGADPGTADLFRVGGNVHIVNGSAVNWGNPSAAHITGDGTPQLRFGGGVTDTLQLTATALEPAADTGLTLGLTSLRFGNIFASLARIGTGQDTITNPIFGIANAGRIDQTWYDTSGAADAKIWAVSVDGQAGANTFTLLTRSDAGVAGQHVFTAVRSANTLVVLNVLADGGSVTVGADPGGSALLRIGGNELINGSLSILPVPSVTPSLINAAGTVTGGGISFAMSFQPKFDSTVVTLGVGFWVNCSTSAAAFTMATWQGIRLSNPTLGAGSAITTAEAIWIDNITIGGTNYAIFTNTGLVSIGDATTIRAGGLEVSAGNIGIGTAAPLTSVGIQDGGTRSGAVSEYGYYFGGTFDSSCTSSGVGIRIIPNTAAAAFTMVQGISLWLSGWTKGAGSTITTLYGLFVDSVTQGGTNYAIFTNTGTIHLGDVTTIGTDPGGTDILRVGGALTINDTKIMTTKTAFTNNAAANTATLTNAPAAGNPTKWIPINDNGVTRNIPAW